MGFWAQTLGIIKCQLSLGEGVFGTMPIWLTAASTAFGIASGIGSGIGIGIGNGEGVLDG